jgi:excisionase family DNA binding protein
MDVGNVPDMTEGLTQQFEPLAIDARQAAMLLGLSRSMFYKMMEAGRIGPRGHRFGKAVRFSVAELRAWAAAGMPPRQEWLMRRDKA